MPLDKILGDLLSAPTSGQMSLGGLLKNKKARKFLRKNGLSIGGTAAVAGVGFLAYREWQKSQGLGQAAPALPSSGSAPPPLAGAGQVAAPPPLPTDLSQASASPPAEANGDQRAMNLVKAMIGAAHADGGVDQREMTAIVASLENDELTADEKAELTAALNVPPTVEDIASLASTERKELKFMLRPCLRST